jgi:hypothetical protein
MSSVSNCRIVDRFRLSSLTYGNVSTQAVVALWAQPSGLLAICCRDRCNLIYSFFGLRLCA